MPHCGNEFVKQFCALPLSQNSGSAPARDNAALGQSPTQISNYHIEIESSQSTCFLI